MLKGNNQEINNKKEERIMNAIEREVLQDIFTYFERFGDYGNRYRGIMMDIATEIIIKNANNQLPELMDKIRKDKVDRDKKYHA